MEKLEQTNFWTWKRKSPFVTRFGTVSNDALLI